MDDYHFSNIAKINKQIVPNHIGENKNLQFYKKNGHIFCNENKILKDFNECIIELTLNLQRF
jgi:hypothetical protein